MGEKQLKILFLNIYQGGVLRGAERFVEEVSKRLNKNHKVLVVSGNKKQIKRWPLIWRIFLDPPGIQILLFTLKNIPLILKEKPDVVIPLNSGWMPFLVRLITWTYKGKVVIAGQSGMGWDDRVNLYSCPNTFVAISTKAKDWAKKINPLVNVKYIPNGVDINLFTPNGKKFKTKLKGPIVMCQGALTRTKRIDLTIKAVSKTKDLSLLIVGDGPLRQKLVSLGEKLLKNRFELVSNIPFNKMPEVYRAADLFTLVSEDYYAFEIALVEAMATNLPVVANNDEIRKQIVKDAGLLVDPSNVNEYSKTLENVLKRDWGDKPRKTARDFDWDNITDNYNRLFYNLLK